MSTPTITAIETVPFQLPVRRDFRWAGMRSDVGTFVLVRVHTDTGLVGVGEATPLPDWGGDHQRRGGETPETVAHVITDLLAPALQGCDALAIAANESRMDDVLRGHGYAKNAVDMALHDLAGRHAGVPLYRLWGGPARDAVPVAHMVGLMPVDDAVDEAASAVDDGATALQLKGGVDADRDVELVQRIREAVGPDVILRLDANQGYGRAKAALRVLDAVDGVLDLIEQPVEGLAELAAVTAAVRLGVIADESCWDPADALELVGRNGADHVSIYLAKAGGMSRARRVAAIVGASGRSCDVNGSLESAVGNAANVQFALAVPEVRLPAVIPVSAVAEDRTTDVCGAYYADDIVTRSFPFADGALRPLDAPGLGVEIDEAKLDRYRVD